MFMTKLKIAVVMSLVIGVAGGGVLTQAWTAAPPLEAKAEDPPPQPDGGEKKNAKPVAVKVIEPRSSGRPQSFVWEALTQPAQEQQLFSLVSGTIKTVAVDVGDHVKKGQELIRLDAPLVLNEVEQAQASLEIARARMEEAKKTASRMNELVRTGAIDVEKHDATIAALKAAEANVRLAQAALDKARIQESFTHLTAEFDGVVAERNCDPGNLVQSGTSGRGKPLLTLVCVDRLRVTVKLTPTLAKITDIAERGSQAQLSVQGVNFPGRDPEGALVPNGGELRGDPKGFIVGRIARISPVVKSGGQRSVVIEVPNPDNRLVPGAKVGVQIFFNKKRTPYVALVPWKCLVQSGGKSYVFIVRDGKAQRVPVTIKDIIKSNQADDSEQGKDGDDARITGIQPSDLVAVSNQGKLATGTPVKTELIKDWLEKER